MTAADVDVAELYWPVANEMKIRIDAALSYLKLLQPPSYPNVESAALQLRQVLELVMLSTLVTHRNNFTIAEKRLRKSDHNNAKKLVEEINPDWYPVPYVDGVDAATGLRSMVPLADGFLAKADWGRAYGRMSDIVHGHNPFADRAQPNELAIEVADLAGRLIKLLNQHWISLPDGAGGVVAQMVASSDGTGGPDATVATYVFTPATGPRDSSSDKGSR